LKELAIASGGKYFADIKDIETISKEVQALTGNYYVLGYYVEDNWDGEYHQINVDVSRPGLNVMAQDGYFNPKPFSQFTDFEKQLHLFDLVFTDNPAKLNPLEIPIEPLFIADNKQTNFALLARLEVNEKTGIPRSRTEIFTFLFNKEEEVVLKKRGEINLSSFNQETLFLYFTAHLPPGTYECRMAVRNLETGQTAIGKIPFLIPEKTDTELVLSSPILFAPGPESRIIRLNSEGKDKDASLSEFYRFIPKNHRLIIRELEPEIEYILAVLPMTLTAGPDAEIDVSVRLHPRPDGEVIYLPVSFVEVQKISANKDLLMLEIGISGVATGDYELEIEAIEVETLARSSVRKFVTRK
ncbi:hypothetical protein KA005_73360, partial [bacterium]|nr:hypothetical protein [bacterium]